MSLITYEQIDALNVGERIRLPIPKWGDKGGKIHEMATKVHAETGKSFEIQNEPVGKDRWVFWLARGK